MESCSLKERRNHYVQCVRSAQISKRKKEKKTFFLFEIKIFHFHRADGYMKLFSARTIQTKRSSLWCVFLSLSFSLSFVNLEFHHWNLNCIESRNKIQSRVRQAFVLRKHTHTHVSVSKKEASSAKKINQINNNISTMWNIRASVYMRRVWEKRWRARTQTHTES